ncbi:MAG: hypothetical protein NTY68_00395 [Candidatus Micrarchaeota archaeon]|nr:hypothetical protein [Candidatus Micrarchaeota archaeon]
MEIVITLESYDDIFDDFDPRPFNERSLSADFINVLNERIKKVDFSRQINLILTMPKEQRSMKEEKTIEKKLKEHFITSSGYWKNKGKDMIGISILYLLGGLAIYIGGGMIDDYIHTLKQYLIIPSWFLTWRALEMIVIDYPKANSRKQFYQYISNAKIEFKNNDFYKA